MWRLVVIIFITSVYSGTCAEDNFQEITINVFRNISNSGELECVGVPTNLVFNETFRIYVNHTGDIYRHRCYRNSERNDGFIERFEKNDLNNRPGYVSEICITTQLGNWHYACEFYTRKCNVSNTDDCWFFVYKYGQLDSYHDHGVKCKVEVSVLKREKFNSTVLDSTLICSATGGALVIAIAVVLIFVVCKKRKHTPKLETTYIDYTQQKHKEQTPSPIQCPDEYAVPVDSKESITYSVPYNSRTDQETYSTPVPVDKHHGPMQSARAQSELLYAELQLGRSEDFPTVGYRNTTANDDNYGRIIHTNRSQFVTPTGV